MLLLRVPVCRCFVCFTYTGGGGGGTSDNPIFFNPKTRSDSAYKSESDIDI